ncbi:MAG: glycosyl transferase [Flavobacteriales bacterium CG_4_9_14_3_um_filter_40_17]|nr:MAG: glycosyl transferase [Flavobacteriales bacterium CG_4_9_14_3_um_filter_40_17]
MKTQNRPKISALIITYNEILHIREVLQNLSFADEVIVVDSFSTDGTVEVIKEFKEVKLVQRKFKNFTDQRNFACTLASYSWVLFIDADERMSQKLIGEVLEVVSDPNAVSAYFMKRIIFFNGKQLRFGGRQKDKIHRLFQKDKAFYRLGLLVHEKLEVTGLTKVLNNPLVHFPYQNFAHYESKRKHYAKLKAQELFDKKVNPFSFHFYVKPIFKFFQHYLLKLGFLDGHSGLVLSWLNAKYVYKRYVYLKEIKDGNPPGN